MPVTLFDNTHGTLNLIKDCKNVAQARDHAMSLRIKGLCNDFTIKERIGKTWVFLYESSTRIAEEKIK